MKITNKYKKLGKDFLLLTIGNFSSKILVFLLVPLYTSYLSTADYGTADLLVTTISLIVPVITLTISESVMRFALDENSDKKAIFTIGITVIIISILVVILISPILLLVSSIREYYFLFLFYYISYAFNGLIGQYVKGINKVKSYAISGIISTFVTILLNIAFLVIFNMNIVGYLLAISLGLISSIIYLILKEKLYLTLCNIKEINFQLTKEMIKYSIPLIPNNLVWWIVNSSDRYILLYFFSSSVVGIYSVAYKIPTILTTFTSLFSTSMRIASVENFKSKETNEFLNKTYNMFFHFIVLFGGGLIAFTQLIAKILFKNEFFVAWEIAPILLLSFIAYGLAEYLGVIYLADKKTSQIFTTGIMGAIINLSFNFILIPFFCSKGAAIATLMAYVSIWLVRFKGCQNIIPISLKLQDVIISFIFLLSEIAFLYISDIYSIIVFVLFAIYKFLFWKNTK